MQPNREKGAITVFLSIILLVMIILAGVLVDGARIRAGEVQVKRAVESAVVSTLAGYDNRLKERFGIFALNGNNPEKLKETIKDYINKNLMADLGEDQEDYVDETYDYLMGVIKPDGQFEKAKFVDLYDFKVEEVKVSPILNLTENEVTRNQIVEYMKYRAPKELADGFLDKVKAMSDTGKITRINEMEMEIVKLHSEIDEYQVKINKNLTEINKLKYYIFETQYINPYINAVQRYRECLTEIDSVTRKIENLAKNPAGNQAALAQARKELADLNKEQSLLLKERNKAYEKLIKQLKDYRKVNEKTEKLANGMRDCIRDINIRIASLRDYLKTEAGGVSSSYLRQYKQETLSNLDRIQKDIPKQEEANQLVSKLGINVKEVGNAAKGIENFDEEHGTSIDNPMTGSVNSNVLYIMKPLENYNSDIHIGFKSVVAPSSEADPRNSVKGKVDEQFKNQENKESALKKNQSSLPSYKNNGQFPNKVKSKDFSAEDEVYLKKYERFADQNPLTGSVDKTEKEVNPDILDNLSGKVDFSQDKKFTKDALSFVSGLCDTVGQKMEEGSIALRDEFYINEYVLGTFCNAVPELKDKTSTANDLRGNPKDKTVNNEVEYILWGNTSDSTNLNLVKGQILAIRFAIDTANVYRDPVKVRNALAIASAASAWSGGLSIPVIQNLILCSWGMIDAVNDLNALMNGEEVPFFKAYKKIEQAKSPTKELTMSYHDYLRLFLLIESSEQKMNRIEDLIQLKRGGKLSDYNTYLRVEVTVSMKYLFMTQAFMPEDIKTPDGARHRFKVVLYQGY